MKSSRSAKTSRRAKSMTRSHTRQRGVAVITALLLTTLAITIVASLFWQQQVQVRSIENQRMQLQKQWILRGALDWARLILREDGKYSAIDDLSEPWAVPLSETRLDQYVDAASRDVAPSAMLSGAIQDAQARFNLTRLAASGQVLRTEVAAFERLLSVLQQNPSLARVAAEQIAASQRHSETGTDAARPISFLQVDDLLAVAGFTPAVIAAIRDDVIFLPRAHDCRASGAGADSGHGCGRAADRAGSADAHHRNQSAGALSDCIADAQHVMKRLPVVFAFLLFLALSATLAYWLVQWTAPAPRAVSAPPKSERTISPVSAAASLFGGRSPGSTTANVQLRGVVHAGSSSDSVAIIAVEGKPPRALTVNSEITPGVIVKEILNKTVVVSEKGVERELSLPAFAAQESHMTAPQASTPPVPNPPPANPAAAMKTATSSGASGGSSPQGNGMTSPPPARPATRPQGGTAPAASEPARAPSSQ